MAADIMRTGTVLPNSSGLSNNDSALQEIKCRLDISCLENTRKRYGHDDRAFRKS